MTGPPLLHRCAASAPGAYAASLMPRPTPARFVILCTPRSGSELLVDLLHQVPTVTCTGEVFHGRQVRSPKRYLEGRARTSGLRGARAWGCKLLAQHLLQNEQRYGPADVLVRHLVDDGWQLVHLRRADLLATALSFMEATRTGRWHLRDGADGSSADRAFEPIDADIADVFAWLHGCDAHQRWLDELVAPLPHIAVSYERDLQAPQALQRTVDTIATALDVAPVPVVPRVHRGAPPDPWSRLADPEPLKQLLRLTRFAHLVDDGSRPRDVLPGRDD